MEAPDLFMYIIVVDLGLMPVGGALCLVVED
jgi:hypothetical protein